MEPEKMTNEIVFDPAEFFRFQLEHPEYSQPIKAKFTVTAHPATEGGIPSVGISLHGAPDSEPGALIDYFTKDGK